MALRGHARELLRQEGLAEALLQAPERVEAGSQERVVQELADACAGGGGWERVAGGGGSSSDAGVNPLRRALSFVPDGWDGGDGGGGGRLLFLEAGPGAGGSTVLAQVSRRAPTLNRSAACWRQSIALCAGIRLLRRAPET